MSLKHSIQGQQKNNARWLPWIGDQGL